MNVNLPNHSKGFTLIELLVVMSIVAIIGGGIIPSFSNYLKEQNLKQAQELVKSELRTIQNRALTGASSNEEIGVVRARYWGVLFRSDSGVVSSFISINTSCPLVSGEYTLKGDFTITNGVVFKDSTDRCMFFDIKNGDIISNDYNPIELNYLNSSASDPNKLITFTTAGLIY